ncbi:MAG: M42 family metallopeptidase [Niameybacter sp.]|uniref:M42 family metallopeptidase n=1 Tax=Niameybacter sp. TaxID=2033640 RepID=UPI002FC9F508
MEFKFDYDYIEKLTQTNGISGHEGAVAKLMHDELKDLCDEVLFDNLGSIIFVKKGPENAPKVMISAHLDQIGFIIADIDDKGFAFIKPIGGWWPAQLMTQDVCVTTEDGKEYPGVIGHKPSKELTQKAKIEFDDLFIDFGVKDKEELLGLGIQVGDPVTPVSAYKPLANPRYVATKAWDNRVGCAIISELLKNIQGQELPCTLYLAGTVQEEVGIRGAKTCAQIINPDVCISTDIGAYGDTPGCKSFDSTLKLGEGPSIAILDATAMGNKKFIKLAREVAKKNDIPYQTDVMLGGGTDTGEMHKAHDGAVPLTVSIATRYGHAHNSVIHLDDLENSVRLFAHLAKELTTEKVQDLKTFF